MGWFRNLTVIAALGIASCAAEPDPVASASATVAEPAQPNAKPCPTPDPNRACLADTHDLAADFAKAMKGDYAAQRNTAYAFSGESPYVDADAAQGCAWRMVIMVSAPTDSTFDDAGMYRIQCGDLSPDKLRTARKIAETIHQRIWGVELGPLPPIAAQ